MNITSKKVRVNLDPYWDEKWTNQYISEVLDINANTVSSYKNGNIRNPKIDVLLKFRDFFQERYQKKLILEDLLKVE